MQAEASAQMGTLLPREKHKAAYDKALVQRYQHMPDIRRIARHRHVPAAIYKVRAAQSFDASLDRVHGMRCKQRGAHSDGHAQAPLTQAAHGAIVASQATKLRRQITDADANKERRRIAHSRPGTRTVKPARKRKILAELE